MGFTPQQVRAMSLWDLAQSVTGWKRANGVKDAPKAPSDDLFEKWTTDAED